MTDTELTPSPETTPAELFLRHKPRLFSVAYRILGTVHEAEEVIQDVYVQWHQMDRRNIANPRALLTTLAARRATDLLRKASRQRETYVGSWLPGPLLTESGPGATLVTEAGGEPEAELELANSLSLAFMVMLEKLSPRERAIYVLRQGFDYSFREVAEQMALSEANCRKIFSRAMQRLQVDTPRFNTSKEQHSQLMQHFQAAMESGDIGAFSDFLARDAVLYSDGGGKALAALRPIYGAEKIGRFIAAMARKSRAYQPRFQICDINGLPGMVWWGGDQVDSIVSVDFRDDKVSDIFVMRNPDKIGYIQARLTGCQSTRQSG